MSSSHSQIAWMCQAICQCQCVRNLLRRFEITPGNQNVLNLVGGWMVLSTVFWQTQRRQCSYQNNPIYLLNRSICEGGENGCWQVVSSNKRQLVQSNCSSLTRVGLRNYITKTFQWDQQENRCFLCNHSFIVHKHFVIVTWWSFWKMKRHLN